MEFRNVKRALSKEADAKIKKALQERRDALKQRISALRKSRASAVSRVRHQCKRSRERVRERAKEIRAAHREAANAEVEQLRTAAKQACQTNTKKAKKRGKNEQAALAKEAREALRDQRILARATAKKPSAARQRQRRAEQLTEDDDAVRDNLDPQLVPVWNEMRDVFKPKKHISRTEQFLQWVEENPGAVIELQSELADATVDELIAQAQAEYQLSGRLAKKTKLRAADYDALGISADDIAALGLDPSDPADVAAYLEHGTQQLAEAVPF